MHSTVNVIPSTLKTLGMTIAVKCTCFMIIYLSASYCNRILLDWCISTLRQFTVNCSCPMYNWSAKLLSGSFHVYMTWKPTVPDCFFSALTKLVKTNVHAFLLLQHRFSFVDHFLIWWQTNKAGFVNNLLHTILLCFRCFVSRCWYWTVLLLLYSATFIRHVFTFYHFQFHPLPFIFHCY